MKTSDIRPENAIAGQQEAMDKDVAMLLEHADEFVSVSCPACDADVPEHHFDRNGFSYWRCSSCGAIYTNPRPSKDLLGKFYAQSEVYKYWSGNVYEASAESRKRLIFRPRAERLVEVCKGAGLEGGGLIEIGASQGFFCEEVRDLEYFDRIVGIEPTPDQARICRGKGFEVYEETYETARIDFKANAIASFETIEHLFSPAEFMSWAFERLNPGGFLMLTCPNIRGFETMVLGAESGAVDHEHLNYFSPQSFEVLAKRIGYENISISTPGKLDVEIVQEALSSGKIEADQLDPFVHALVSTNNPEIDRAFQDLIQKANLSSNMLIIVQKPA